jgi:hypothetical protein
VHIAFGYRVIETTVEPFGGHSAPTLYAEIALDTDGAWKHALSEHKDRILRWRDDLMRSISEALTPLLDKARRQASHLALRSVLTPIEAKLTLALKGAGVLHIADDGAKGDEGDSERQRRGGKGGGSGRNGRLPTVEGASAREIERPTGVRIEVVETSFLEGKLYSWEISDKALIVRLDKELFADSVGWPPRLAEPAIIQLVTSYLSHAIEMEFRSGKTGILKTLTPQLRERIKDWAEGEGWAIAPRLNRALLVDMPGSPRTGNGEAR